jgi:dolichyl-phosphate-mannose--protein O-mannosyl transferase
MIKKLYQNHHVMLWLIFVVALLVRGYDLGGQPPTDDEVAAASAATNYQRTGLFGQVMWYHPPLRNIVIFVSGKIFGEYSAWGLRFGSLLFGSVAVLLLGYLAYGLFRDRLTSYLAALFLCVDPLHISLSREAFQETTSSFFIVAGVLAAYYAIRKENLLLCYVSGALFGIATASKWNGLFPWAVSAVSYYAAPWFLEGREHQRTPLSRLVAVLAAYGAVPVLFYVLIHLPWLLRGYSLTEFVRFQAWLLKLQYHYKGTPYTEDVLSHSAWQWFLWPVAWVDFVFHEGKAYLNIAIGNYLVWVLTLPSLYFSVREWLRERSFSLGFVIAAFVVSYLPLLLTTRAIWVFIATPVILFAFLLSARTISVLFDQGKIRLRALVVYLVAVVLLSTAMYPLGTFRALDYPLFKPLTELYTPHMDDKH